MSRRPAPALRWAVGARAVAIGATIAVSAACAGSGDPASDPPVNARARAVADARHFLHAEVARNGRVVRHDQGGDTVSEGQGYGLLLALAAGDRTGFGRIWSWTRRHLQERSGLFAYHWPAGSAADRMPAADADTQIAWALDLAGHRRHSPLWTAAAKRIAEAVAGSEVGYDDQGHPTLAAGPWAVPTGQPATVEPGYWTYPADSALASLTGDKRWAALAAADGAHLSELTADGARLPADWAQVGAGQGMTPVAHPAGAAVVSGQDGLRALVWADCTSRTRRLSMKWWGLIRATADQAPLSRSLNGAPADRDRSPLSDVAAAAAAAAAGHPVERDRLLSAADELERRYPTYYGSAWAALGRVLLTTDLLTPACRTG